MESEARSPSVAVQNCDCFETTAFPSKLRTVPLSEVQERNSSCCGPISDSPHLDQPPGTKKSISCQLPPIFRPPPACSGGHHHFLQGPARKQEQRQMPPPLAGRALQKGNIGHTRYDPLQPPFPQILVQSNHFPVVFSSLPFKTHCLTDWISHIFSVPLEIRNGCWLENNQRLYGQFTKLIHRHEQL